MSGVQLSCVVYRRLLVLFPRDFRSRFGEEMAAVFEDCLLELARRRQSLEIARTWTLALREIVTVAVPLRLRDAPVIAGAASLITSLVLFLAFFRAVSKHC